MLEFIQHLPSLGPSLVQVLRNDRKEFAGNQVLLGPSSCPVFPLPMDWAEESLRCRILSPQDHGTGKIVVNVNRYCRIHRCADTDRNASLYTVNEKDWSTVPLTWWPSISMLTQRGLDTQELPPHGILTTIPHLLDSRRTPSLVLSSHALGRNHIGNGSWKCIQEQRLSAVVTASRPHCLQSTGTIKQLCAVRTLVLRGSRSPWGADREPIPECNCALNHKLPPLLSSVSWITHYGPNTEEWSKSPQLHLLLGWKDNNNPGSWLLFHHG
jgi:hypothetical protein